MGLLSAVSVARILLSVQRQSFLVKPFLAYPVIQKSFKSDIPDYVEEYIQRGKTAAENRSVGLINLENLIEHYDKSETYKKLLSTEEYKNCGLKNQFFIALALPSMTGKTQMAFNIRCKRPLYFALDYTQNINDFFALISAKFTTLLKSDYKKARKVVISTILYKDKSMSANVMNITEIITLEIMKKYLLHHKFESLGFIVSLVQECEKSYKKSTNDEWMRFYAENQAALQCLEYKPISLADFTFQKESVYNALLEQYFFFVDEFSADPGIVMFRNMCRYLSTPCLVASTNSKVVNLIGTSDISGSGASPPSVFCAVFPKLSSLSNVEIEQFFNEEINFDRFLELARNVSESEERRMSLLLQFFKDQAKISRPGVALYLFEALKQIYESFKESKSLKVDAVFKKVLESMVSLIKKRKPLAFSNDAGMKTNVDLLGGEEFDSKYVPYEKSGVNDSSRVDKHFFYLKNPRTGSKPVEPYLLFRNFDQNPQLIPNPDTSDPFEIQAFFDEKEELLKLACLFTGMTKSSYGIVYPYLGINRKTADLGEELEGVTYAAFLTTSHCNDKESISLEGVGIKDFLRNFLASFDRQAILFHLMRKSVKLNCEAVKDDQILAGTVVPSLYIANHDWPSEIKAVFDTKESTSVKLGKYMRTPNNAEIDATIDLFDKDGRNCLGVIECKHRGSSVGEAEYTKIIEKAIKYAKVQRIQNCFNTLRPIIKPEMIESFESYIENDLKKDVLDPKNEQKARKSFKNLIQNFEDTKKFHVVQRKLKDDYIKEDHLKEFENSLLDLEKLKSTTPLVHFLICTSCSDLKSLDFPGLKINFFRFVKDGQNEYKIIKATDLIHSDPDMVAFIIETDVVNNKNKKNNNKNKKK